MLQVAAREAKLQTMFLHDDLRWNEGGGNLKIAGDKLTFIDWELSGFFADTVPEIGDVLGSIPGTATNKQVCKRLYETYIADETDIGQLNRSIRYGILWGKLGNPLWAAERYFLLRENNHPEIERYKDLAELGMKGAEPFYGLPFSLWFQ